MSDVDRVLLKDFLVESMDGLATLEPKFVELEANPGSTAILNEIFRPVHSLKGNCAFFNLSKTNQFSHKMENLLDELRKGKRTTTPEIVSLLLSGVDHLKNMLQRVMSGKAEVLEPTEQEYLESLEKLLGGAAENPMTQLQKTNDTLNQIVAEFGDKPEFYPLLEKLSGLIKDLQGRLKKSGGPDAGSIGERLVLYKVNETNLTPEIAIIHAFFNMVSTNSLSEDSALVVSDTIKRLYTKLEPFKDKPAYGASKKLRDDFVIIHEANIGFDEILTSSLREDFLALLGFCEKSQITGMPTTAAPAKAEDAKPGEVKPLDETAAKTIRINQDKLDEFMGYVGELVVSYESYRYLHHRLEETSGFPQMELEHLHTANKSFAETSDGLQRSLMEIRRVPVKGLLQRAPRMVRELSSKLGKKVHLTVQGEETEIDKSLLEQIEDPFVHIVRNSLDHGIEMPDVRTKNGKEAEGQMTIRAWGEDGEFFLRVTDDGRGIDPDRVKAKALEKGLITEEKARTMRDSEAIKLVYEPGFSTAEKVTDVSGRGVGLDVVRTNLAKIGGSVHLQSEKGQGCTVDIRMPMAVTLTVIKGLLVQAGDYYFVIPGPVIETIYKPRPEEINKVEGRETLNLREKIYSLLRLTDIYDLPLDEATIHSADVTRTVVVVGKDGKDVALYVEKLHGYQQVVVKPLPEEYKNAPFLDGVAILGGDILPLVIDVEKIIEHFFSA